MSIRVDARGRSCPEPVVMTKVAIEENYNQDIEVLVDANVAVENIIRFVKNKGYNVEVNEEAQEFKLNISK